jgi:hypothetical protein
MILIYVYKVQFVRYIIIIQIKKLYNESNLGTENAVDAAGLSLQCPC